MSLHWGDLGILRAAKNQQAAKAAGPGAGGVSQGVRHGCLCPSPHVTAWLAQFYVCAPLHTFLL